MSTLQRGLQIGGRVAENSTRGLLTALIAAFGNPSQIAKLLAPDVRWWITPTVGVLGSPSVGRQAVTESMEIIFGQMYADVRTDIHHVVTDGSLGAARFTMRATALFADNQPYENEYSLWIEARSGEIARVWEYLDVAHASGQYTS